MYASTILQTLLFFFYIVAFLPPLEWRQFPFLIWIPSYPDIIGQIWGKKRANSKISISGEIVENQIFFPMILIL